MPTKRGFVKLSNGVEIAWVDWINEQLWKGLIDGGTEGIRKASHLIHMAMANQIFDEGVRQEREHPNEWNLHD